MQAKPDTLSPASLSSLSDGVLITTYKAGGDLQVLAELYKRYMGLVYSVCLKYFKNQPASEDAVMDIFEQLISKVKNHEIEHFKPWLGALARNHCLMQLRKKSPESESAVSFDETFMHSGKKLHPNADVMQDGVSEPSEAMQKEFVFTTMEKCLETLAEQQRVSVDLFYLQQKCYRQVADITGYDIDKVRSYIQNGRRNLKICMEKQQSV